METQITNFSLKDTPLAIAIFNHELKVLSCSDKFKRTFAKTQVKIEDKHISEILEDTPKKLLDDLNIGLRGKETLNSIYKFFNENKKSQWLKWNISTLKNDSGSIEGVILVLEDVSQYRREQELFLKGEEVSKTGSWEVDLDSNEIYWSPMTKRIHEVPMEYQPVLEAGINFYKEGESREMITKAVNEAINDHKAWDLELIIVTNKGKETWVRAKGEPEIINGKCIRIYGTFQDIDLKKKSEVKFRELSNRLKVATQAAKIGIWELNTINDVLIWDDNMYNLYGIDKKVFTGIYDAWESVIHKEDKERAAYELKLAIAGKKKFNTEFRIVRPDGQIRNIKAIAHNEIDSNGKSYKITGVNWDITELRKTKLKLERNEESFSETFKNSATGMALVDKQGYWLKVNKGLCDSLGYTEKELMKLTFQEITHPEDLDKDLNLLSETIEGKRDSYQIEKRYFHKNGSIVYAILTVTVVRKINGDLSHFISQIMDFTARKEAEKSLNSLVEVTRSQNESLMNFAHIVSHNLRSHSTNMTMLTKFLTEENDEKEQNNLIEMLVNASDSLSETIHHLNEVVQVKTGALDKMQSIGLLKTLKKIENSIEALLLEKEARTELNVDSSHFIMGVPAYIESIFLNLYTNSLKYSHLERKPIMKISAKVKNEYTEIRFNDNGMGIDLDRHGNKIFGMYKTFHKNKDAKGIGLFITKNQIESMGGNITVESEVNQGTTFTITLKKG